jgi:hypothetical protein
MRGSGTLGSRGDLPAGEVVCGRVKAGHEVNPRDEQEPRREFLTLVDAQSRRLEVEPVGTRAAVFSEGPSRSTSLNRTPGAKKSSSPTLMTAPASFGNTQVGLSRYGPTNLNRDFHFDLAAR